MNCYKIKHIQYRWEDRDLPCTAIITSYWHQLKMANNHTNWRCECFLERCIKHVTVLRQWSFRFTRDLLQSIEVPFVKTKYLINFNSTFSCLNAFFYKDLQSCYRTGRYRNPPMVHCVLLCYPLHLYWTSSLTLTFFIRTARICFDICISSEWNVYQWICKRKCESAWKPLAEYT